MGVDPDTGYPLWKKGDGVTSEYGMADYELQGKATPDAYGGIHNTLSWKGLSLSFLIYYSIGGKVYDSMYASVMHEGGEAGKICMSMNLMHGLPTTEIRIYQLSSTQEH